MLDALISLALVDHVAGEAPEWMKRWLNISRTWEIWWIALGLIAQGLFFARWLVQWIASERKGESTVPTLFWWCSLIGAGMLLIYFIGRREPVGVIGQLVGWVVYSRNLYLIRRKNHSIRDAAEGDVDEPLPLPEDGQSENASDGSRD